MLPLVQYAVGGSLTFMKTFRHDSWKLGAHEISLQQLQYAFNVSVYVSVHLLVEAVEQRLHALGPFLTFFFNCANPIKLNCFLTARIQSSGSFLSNMTEIHSVQVVFYHF